MNARAVRQSALGALRGAGLFSLAANSSRRRQRLLILCYHGISLADEDRWLGHLFVSPERFERRLQLLRSFDANVLPLGDAVERLRLGTLPPRSVVITFDDGFVDFHVHAVPLLRKFGYPATLYLTTHYCGYSVPIFNLMANYLMWKSGRETLELPQFGLAGPHPIGDYSARQAVVASLVKRAEADNRGTEPKDLMARSLATSLGIDYNRILAGRILQLMNPEEVAQVAGAGIDIELHTHRHRTPRDRDLFLREIHDNAARIHEMTGRAPRHFCYPSGDYDRLFFPWLREAHVDTATTCVPGLATVGTEPFLLPRMLDDSIASDLDFERWLSGFLV